MPAIFFYTNPPENIHKNDLKEFKRSITYCAMYDISAEIYLYIYFLHFGNTLLLHCGQSVNSIKLRPEKK